MCFSCRNLLYSLLIFLYFRDALVKAYQPLPLLQDVSVYVTQDCTSKFLYKMALLSFSDKPLALMLKSKTYCT